MNAAARGIALACSLAMACASPSRPPPLTAPTSVAIAAPSPETAPTEADLAALDALVALVRGNDRGATASLGVALSPSHGAREVTGEPAPDDSVRESALAARVGATAALLVTTTCGNAWLVSVHLVTGRWTAVDRVGIVSEAHPGACRLTHAAAASCAMMTREASEVVVTFASESEEGDEARDPTLRVYHLAPGGSLQPLSGDIGFGGTDDATGAVREAEWVVDEALLLPRDLYVQVQPGRPGPGGTAPPFVVRRTYHLEGHRLVLADETSSPLLPRTRPYELPTGRRAE